MNIFLNGARSDCGEARTVQEVIERRHLSAATTLVELNGEALHRREWPARPLQEDDRIEILRVAAGG
ncbi:MAG: sulfur carrier protein ThiS [Chthoniobacterales bacterium]